MTFDEKNQELIEKLEDLTDRSTKVVRLPLLARLKLINKKLTTFTLINQNFNLVRQKTEVDIPKDADLILVTHGHFDDASSAPDLLKASVKNDAKIACIFEIGQYYSKWKDVPDAKIIFMNKGGTWKLDNKWAKKKLEDTY